MPEVVSFDGLWCGTCDAVRGADLWILGNDGFTRCGECRTPMVMTQVVRCPECSECVMAVDFKDHLSGGCAEK
jgi:hypothetical protein